jgi:2-phospho-L-lactate guanylyltransferase
MSVWAIIPVKPLRVAKSRLSEVLSPEDRQRFAESMLRHVLSVVSNVPQVAGTLVISRDSKALSIAREYGAHTVQESGNPELNVALMRATQVIASWRSAAVLVLPADLPLIAPEDVSGIIALGERTPSIVIATDRNQDGTNALFLRPPGLIPYAYGNGSYQRHVNLGFEAGAIVHEYHSERLVLDIDLPEDIVRYNEIIGSDDPKSIEVFIPDNAG